MYRKSIAFRCRAMRTLLSTTILQLTTRLSHNNRLFAGVHGIHQQKIVCWDNRYRQTFKFLCCCLQKVFTRRAKRRRTISVRHAQNPPHPQHLPFRGHKCFMFYNRCLYIHNIQVSKKLVSIWYIFFKY